MASLTVTVFLISSAGYVASEQCGTSGRICAPKATCNTVTSKCRCDPPYWGNGLLRCYESNQVAAQIYTDVKLTTFKNETVDFPYPCRYEVTSVSTSLFGQRRCVFKIIAFNKRFRGKTVLHGFDVISTIDYKRGLKDSDIRSVRIFGIANNGVNNISIMASVNSTNMKSGPWYANVNPNYTDTVHNVYIKVYEDTNNGMVVYKSEACGVEINFKPYDVVLRLNQPRVPGLFISINTAHRPSWHPRNWNAGLNLKLSLDDMIYKGLGNISDKNERRSASFVQRAMEMSKSRGIDQNQPDGQPGCVSLLNNICRDKYWIFEAYNDCFWMLKEARFIRCLSENGMDHVDFFRRCITSHCDEDQKSCTNLMAEIPRVCHLSGIRKLTEFIKGDLCIDAWRVTVV